MKSRLPKDGTKCLHSHVRGAVGSAKSKGLGGRYRPGNDESVGSKPETSFTLLRDSDSLAESSEAEATSPGRVAPVWLANVVYRTFRSLLT
jgi:hypothetical protein